MSHLDELKELATKVLVSGEGVLAAADARYAGKVNLHQPARGLVDLGHVEAQLAAGEALAERYGEHPGASFPSARQMALVLTDQRLLCWSRGGLRGKPKAFIGEVPLDTIGQVGYENPGRLTLHLLSGWEVQLELTGDGEPADLVRGLVQATGSGSPAAPDAHEAEA